jgi:hypothetical protein
MTTFGYKNPDGHRLEVTGTINGRATLISLWPIGDLRPVTIDIPAADAPGIVLNLLLAAGFHGQPKDHIEPQDVELAVDVLARFVQEQERTAAKAELDRRRCELASELMTGGTIRVTGAPDPESPMGRAITKIMTLQDQAAAK